jgi:hypothetical protein
MPPEHTGQSSIYQLLSPVIHSDEREAGERIGAGGVPEPVPDRAQGSRPGTVLRDAAVPLPWYHESRDTHPACSHSIEYKAHGKIVVEVAGTAAEFGGGGVRSGEKGKRGGAHDLKMPFTTE